MDKISAEELPGSKKIGVLKDGTCVFEVNGKNVRDTHSVEWIGGGHSLVNDFIPDDEIWVEEMESGDEEALIAHEIVEFCLMKYANWDYEKAHDYANTAEAIIRGNDAEEKSEEQDVEKGTENEVKEHKISTIMAKKLAMDHEKEHPMYYSKMESAGLGKHDSKAAIMIMIGKRKAVAGKKGMPNPGKIPIVMKEFGLGGLHSGSDNGPKVTNRKQAIAIALSQARHKK